MQVYIVVVVIDKLSLVELVYSYTLVGILNTNADYIVVMKVGILTEL